MLSDPGDGDSAIQLDEATGAAPRARLSIVDGQGGNGVSGGYLWLPFDAYRLYLPVRGAREFGVWLGFGVGARRFCGAGT
jgi:hypothetical protein